MASLDLFYGFLMDISPGLSRSLSRVRCRAIPGRVLLISHLVITSVKPFRVPPGPMIMIIIVGIICITIVTIIIIMIILLISIMVSTIIVSAISPWRHASRVVPCPCIAVSWSITIITVLWFKVEVIVLVSVVCRWASSHSIDISTSSVTPWKGVCVSMEKPWSVRGWGSFSPSVSFSNVGEVLTMWNKEKRCCWTVYRDKHRVES